MRRQRHLWHMWQLPTVSMYHLAWLRKISVVAATGLAIATLSLVLSGYEGLQSEFRSFLSDPLAHSVRVTYGLRDTDKINQFNVLAPEGLSLFRSNNLNEYFPESDELLVIPPPRVNDADVNLLGSIQGVEGVAWRIFEAPFKASAEMELPVARVPPTFFDIQKLQLARGRLPASEEGPDAVILGHQAAQVLFGSGDPLGATLEPNRNTVASDKLQAATRFFGASVYPYQFKVVGVLAPAGDKRPELERLSDVTIFRVSDSLQPPESVGGFADDIWVQGRLEQQTLLAAEIERRLGERYANNLRWTVVAQPVRDQFVHELMRQFQATATQNLSGIIVFALILAGLTIGLASYFGVLLRAREIGIRRSLGATGRQIGFAFLVEGLGLSLIGALLGLGLGFGTHSLLLRLSDTSAVFGWLTIAAALAAALSVGYASTILPAMRATRVSPVSGFRKHIGAQLHRHRWLWGGVGIACSLLILVVIMGLRDGLRTRMDQILGWTGARTVSFVPWKTGLLSVNNPAYLSINDYEAVRSAFPDWNVAYLGDTRYDAVEVSLNLPELRPIQLRCGRWFNEEEARQRKQVLVLGPQRAAQLARDQKVDDPCAVTRWRGIPVVGVLDEWEGLAASGYGPWKAYYPVGARVNPSLGSNGVWDWDMMGDLLIGQVIVEVPPDEDLGEAATRLKDFLAARHLEGEPQMILPAGVTEDLLARRSQIYTLAGVMAAACLLIGLLGLMNLTFIAVLSRSREIGIRRALGAPRRQIMMQVLGETVRLCLGAAALGTAAGLVITYVLQQRWGWPPVWHLDLIGVALALAVVSGLLAGALPAWWAASLSPTRAIKTE
jgi:ABC-type antimicrobial peptide transport system permease subunit